MSVLRFDLATNDWVIFAPTRALRPHDQHVLTHPPAEVPPLTACPFCPGNESFTPPEIYSIKDSHGQWRVRVVANRFPALRIEDDPRRVEEGPGFYSMGGCGAHEVIVESPEHGTVLPQQSEEQIDALLHTLHFRSTDLIGDRRFQTVIVFKNHGTAAGTSLSHPHWQLIATPIVPRLSRLKHNVAAEYFDRTGDCLYGDILDHELASGQRLIGQNSEFVAFIPFAAHLPFEIWIMPRRRQASFSLLQPEQVRPLSELLKKVLLKLYAALDNPAYNLTITTVPRGDEDKEYFVWHICILPRISTTAGFELGSGMSINSVMPEEAALFLGQNSAMPINTS